MIRGRLRWHGDRPEAEPAEPQYIEIDPRELSGIFNVPEWLRNVGLMSWLLVGVAIFLVGAVWLASLTAVIVVPVITAGIVAAVASPMVAWLRRPPGSPRDSGRPSCCSAIVAIGVGVALMVVGGITGVASAVGGHLADAKDTIAGWLKDLGIDPSKVDQAKDHVSSGASGAVSALLDGLAAGISKLSSIVFFVAMTVLSLFFLLKDGPLIRSWADDHLGVPRQVAQTITQRVLGSLRGYFLGVTIVAAFSAAVVCDRGRDPRRAAGRDDHRGHLPRRLRPVPRRLDGGRVLGADRARRLGHGRGDRDDRRPAARQRPAPAAGAAAGDGRGARHPPARGADRDDRRRRAVRGHRA